MSGRRCRVQLRSIDEPSARPVPPGWRVTHRPPDKTSTWTQWASLRGQASWPRCLESPQDPPRSFPSPGWAASTCPEPVTPTCSCLLQPLRLTVKLVGRCVFPIDLVKQALAQESVFSQATRKADEWSFPGQVQKRARSFASCMSLTKEAPVRYRSGLEVT